MDETKIRNSSIVDSLANDLLDLTSFYFRNNNLLVVILVLTESRIQHGRFHAISKHELDASQSKIW